VPSVNDRGQHLPSLCLILPSAARLHRQSSVHGCTVLTSSGVLLQASTRNQPVPAARVPKAATGTEKTVTDVIAGAVARAASQSTIHPLDTFKVRLQAGYIKGLATAVRLALLHHGFS
jgi:hypothetical protein